jgi:MoxR-like ATPase
MPSDVSGFSIYNQKSGEFEFRPGAAMSNIILADEINRASAKTQSALLEIMEERQVTVDSKTYVMEQPYMVLATQNPIESLGTYQLPEAQIDRFMIKLSIGYPAFEDEIKIVLEGEEAKQSIANVVGKQDVRNLMADSSRVICSTLVASYIVRIVEATRNHPDIKLGSSPRGSIALHKLSRAYALSRGRNYVIPDDIKYLAPYVLGHRIILTHAAATEKSSRRTDRRDHQGYRRTCGSDAPEDRNDAGPTDRKNGPEGHDPAADSRRVACPGRLRGKHLRLPAVSGAPLSSASVFYLPACGQARRPF